MTYPIAEFCADVGDVPHATDAMTIRKKSRDQFAVSPLLRQSLAGRVADVVVSPRSKDDVLTIIKAAVRHRIPLTARGGGTANYGQSVPLQGGILLDMTGLSGIVSISEGNVRALSGTCMADIDLAAREKGWEMRIHPSTRSVSSIAGFVAGGSGGMGSCQWGMLRDRGNITAMEVVSVEAEPRFVELRGRDVELVHHAYGTNAIITEVEMPTTPAWTWKEVIVAFPEFLAASRFGVQLASEPAITKKLISLQEWPVARLMTALGDIVPDGHTMVNCMIAAPTLDAFRGLVDDFGGSIVHESLEGEGFYGAPIYEFAYGHGLRQIQKSQPTYTGLQGMFPADDLLPTIERVHAAWRGTAPLRMEVFLSQGEVVTMGSPGIVYENEAQMAAIVAKLQGFGVKVANSHTTGVREVGIKQFDDRDAVFKRSMDPHKLLNPGKLDFDDIPSSDSRSSLPTQGWSFRKAG